MRLTFLIVLFGCFSAANAWCRDESLCPKILGKLLFCDNPLVLDVLKRAFCVKMCDLCPSVAIMKRKCKPGNRKWEDEEECNDFCAEYPDECPKSKPRTSTEIWGDVDRRDVQGVRVWK
ncbi:hypothetical protein M3Y97_01055700 [Aphelenchoides bicaudatus]|nr:hypothetical protein M3Y97_01055700 [Aphelenchoides bicaudatus]